MRARRNGGFGYASNPHRVYADSLWHDVNRMLADAEDALVMRRCDKAMGLVGKAAQRHGSYHCHMSSLNPGNLAKIDPIDLQRMQQNDRRLHEAIDKVTACWISRLEERRGR